MPPRVKVTRQDIVDAAVGIVRDRGAGALNARELAAALGCSTQPVFSNFASMEALRLAVAEAAEGLYGSYMEREMASGKYPPYKASGMAYIRFAKEERNLFQLLYMRDRTKENIPEESELYGQLQTMVRNSTGASGEQAKLIHLEMWAFVHGIATMIATGYLELDWQLISTMLTDAFQGLKTRLAQGG